MSILSRAAIRRSTTVPHAFCIVKKNPHAPAHGKSTSLIGRFVDVPGIEKLDAWRAPGPENVRFLINFSLQKERFEARREIWRDMARYGEIWRVMTSYVQNEAVQSDFANGPLRRFDAE